MVGQVCSVTRIEAVNDAMDYCSIDIDFDCHHIFGVFSELLGFVGKRVRYNVRSDMYKGQIITVITDIADTYKIQTLGEVEGIRLVPADSEARPGCNFDSRSLKFGDTQIHASAFMSRAVRGSSLRSTWYDCSMIDSYSRLFEIRFFTNNATSDNGNIDRTIEEMVGHYVRFDVTHTKFGLQADRMELLEIPVLEPPEVETAVQIILSETTEDSELRDYMDRNNFIDTIRKIVYYEPGLHLVDIAGELSIIKTLRNISNVYDDRLLKRAAVTSRGYLLPSKTRFSKQVLNVNRVLKSELVTDRELLLILDKSAEEPASPTKSIYSGVSQFAKRVLEERRGYFNEDKEVVFTGRMCRSGDWVF